MHILEKRFGTGCLKGLGVGIQNRWGKGQLFIVWHKIRFFFFQCLSSVCQSYLTLQPHGLQHTRFPCLLPTSGACSNSSLSSQWCRPTISFSVIPFCLQPFLASGSFPMSHFFTSGAWVLAMNIQDWFPLGLTGLILQSKGLLRVLFNTVQKHRFFGT